MPVRSIAAGLLAGAAIAGTAATQAVGVSDAFRSPTENIVCFYQGPGGYEPVQLVCQTCNDGFTVTLRAGGKARVQHSQPRAQAAGLRTVRYGRSWNRGHFACRMTRKNIGCMSMKSGHMFFLSREHFWRDRA